MDTIIDLRTTTSETNHHLWFLWRDWLHCMSWRLTISMLSQKVCLGQWQIFMIHISTCHYSIC